MPDEANPPLVPMAEWILGLQHIEKQEKNCVLSACGCKADGYYNVFPDDALIQGTIRTLNEVQRKRIFKKLENMTQKLSKKYNILMEFLPVTEYPPCENSAEVLAEYIKGAVETVGKENVRKGEPTYAAEDFAFFTKACGGAHIRIGCTNSPETAHPLHNPNFQIAEECLITGAELFSNIALNHR